MMKVNREDWVEVVSLRSVGFYNQRSQLELSFDELVSCEALGNKEFSSRI